ncbi:Gp37Gp68 family protein [Fibrisoma limi BUZ 3]|uniref:Gp37Gp68 family protein n=1 Tax=Fibrisoma limi BUZ 3 TaxID=1185876 RepID=I2GKS6_9BACT|nr:phage Gp37/Gp68 family protein [Fibrisoma limi]CCH54502.1 Gp37Gp68 family protein [Fibrisoma limi BUZ 3]
MADTSIEWTGKTWNPTTGCTKISQGCKFCYAETMHRRLRAMGQPKYSEPFTTLQTHPGELHLPYKWRKPELIFVNSMSDLFHKDIPLTFIQKVFAVMCEASWHTYQVLTKRADLLAEYSPAINWSDNVWMGVSVESEEHVWRIDALRRTGAKVKFLSLEPLIGPLPNLDLTGIDWVIVGGESGRKPRPMQREWVEDIQRQCEAAGVAFFFKQWGGTNKKAAGRLLNGRTYDEMPFTYQANNQ